MYSHRETLAPNQVAELTGLSRGAVSKLIERLLKKGFVGREISFQDRRYQVLKLTSQGKQLVPGLAKLADQNDEQFFSKLSGAERKTLSQLLKKIAESNKITKIPIE